MITRSYHAMVTGKLRWHIGGSSAAGRRGIGVCAAPFVFAFPHFRLPTLPTDLVVGRFIRADIKKLEIPVVKARAAVTAPEEVQATVL